MTAQHPMNARQARLARREVRSLLGDRATTVVDEIRNQHDAATVAIRQLGVDLGKEVKARQQLEARTTEAHDVILRSLQALRVEQQAFLSLGFWSRLQWLVTGRVA